MLASSLILANDGKGPKWAKIDALKMMMNTSSSYAGQVKQNDCEII
jgi:hypothetical protein